MQGRYSDEQLYALARYVQLQAASQPQQVRHNGGTRLRKSFLKKKVARDVPHTHLLYTNNKLTPSRWIRRCPAGQRGEV